MASFSTFRGFEKFLVLLLVFIAGVCAYVSMYSKDAPSVKLINTPAASFNEGWYYVDKNGERVEVGSLPAKIPCDGVGISVLYHDYVAFEGKHISFYTHHQDARLYLNKAEIYDFHVRNNPSWLSSFRAFYHIVKLPPILNGVIRLELQSVVPGHDGEYNAMYIGDKTQIIYRYMLNRFDKLVLGLVLFVFGIVVLILGCVFLLNFEKHDWTLVHISLLALFTGIWQLEESRCLQFFMGSQALHWNLEYMFQFLVLYTALLVLNDMSSFHLKPKTFLFSLCVVGLSFVQLALQFSGVMQITKSAFLLYIMFISCCIYGMYLIFFGVDFKNDFVRKIFIVAIGISATTILTVMILGSSSKRFVADYFLTFALVLVFFSLAVIVYQKSLEEFDKVKQSELYEKLALVDFATGVSSKTAWFSFMEKFNYEKHKGISFCLILFDMNNLKKMNDTYGHIVGDKVIGAFCDCLKKTFYGQGEIFRIGGDEFICLIENATDALVNKLLKKFDGFVESQEETAIKFTAAYGWTMFEPTSVTDFEKAQNIADEHMYENKKQMKSRKDD